MIHRPVYRKEKDRVRDLTTCTAHLENGDEIGLTGRQKVMLQALRMYPRYAVIFTEESTM